MNEISWENMNGESRSCRVKRQQPPTIELLFSIEWLIRTLEYRVSLQIEPMLGIFSFKSYDTECLKAALSPCTITTAAANENTSR